MSRTILSLRLATVALVLALAGCTSTGNIGLIAKPSASPGDLLSGSHPYKELGPAHGRACRFFLLAIVPWGDSTPSAAVEQALQATGGDALLNVSISTSLYGFVPIYNVFSFTCTSVRGIAIELEP